MFFPTRTGFEYHHDNSFIESGVSKLNKWRFWGTECGWKSLRNICKWIWDFRGWLILHRVKYLSQGSFSHLMLLGSSAPPSQNEYLLNLHKPFQLKMVLSSITSAHSLNILCKSQELQNILKDTWGHGINYFPEVINLKSSLCYNLNFVLVPYATTPQPCPTSCYFFLHFSVSKFLSCPYTNCLG